MRRQHPSPAANPTSNVTKPNPFDLPVSLSRMTTVSVMVPQGVKNSRKSSSLTSYLSWRTLALKGGESGSRGPLGPPSPPPPRLPHCGPSPSSSSSSSSSRGAAFSVDPMGGPMSSSDSSSSLRPGVGVGVGHSRTTSDARQRQRRSRWRCERVSQGGGGGGHSGGGGRARPGGWIRHLLLVWRVVLFLRVAVGPVDLATAGPSERERGRRHGS